MKQNNPNNENNNSLYGYNKSRTFSRQSTGRPEGNLIQLKMMEKIILPGDKVKYKCDEIQQNTTQQSSATSNRKKIVK